MAAVRDSDISLWLHNKLGTSADTWSEGSICSQLNVEVLRNIKECFVALQTQVKLKLLLSFLHIPKRNIEEWKGELEGILEVASCDSEPWVGMLAELLKTYPGSGTLNLDIRDPSENQKITHDLVIEMRKLVKKYSELGLLPMECNYLNRNAFIAAACQQVPMVKHFQLKRKPKAAALRAELLIRSVDAQANVKKNQLPAVPVRSRGLPRKSDSIPMRGIPSRTPTNSMRTFNSSQLSRSLGRSANRKDGGIKLLEITESPIVAQQAKKRKKMQDAADAKAAEAEKLKEQQIEKAQAAAATPVKQQSVPAEPTTPDYAAGLTPSNPPTPSPATPTPVVVTTPSALHGTPMTLAVRSPITSGTAGPRLVSDQLTTIAPQRILVASSQGAPGTQTVLYRTVGPSGTTYAQGELVQATPVTNAQTVSVSTGQAQYATLQPVQPDFLYTTGVNLASQNNSGQLQQVIAMAPASQNGVNPPVQLIAPPQVQPAPQKKALSLTKDQMNEASEMFKTSNKVTRPEKALILGFMAGSRDNPCPHLGNIVTIKLSEGEENVKQSDGSIVKMIAEIHFQMNYNTGEWKRLKKLREAPVE